MKKINNGVVIFLIVVILLFGYITYIGFGKVTNKMETATSNKKRIDSDSKNET